MILTTHAITGVAAASLVPSHRVLAFFLAFASHFLIDAIPHWDYHLVSKRYVGGNLMATDMPFGWDFCKDLVKIGFDFVLGLFFSFIIFGLFFNLSFWLILIGVAGGMLPDFLQFVYMKFKHEPLVSLQRFHMWIHTKKRLYGKVFLGILLQATFSAFAVLASALISRV
ncbi:MAG: hypothetical protein Q7R91_03145 [bacterium]|nr:hypothetical protein [bacterium]